MAVSEEDVSIALLATPLSFSLACNVVSPFFSHLFLVHYNLLPTEKKKNLFFTSYKVVR
jgi:hypothetical protein